MTATEVRWRAGNYDRLSTAVQAKTAYTAGKDGTHLKDCRAAAEKIGAEVVFEIEDVDSGAEWDFPGILKVLDLARRRAFDILFVADSSRFARSQAKHLTYVEQLHRCGVRVVFLDLPNVDDTETGAFMLSILGAKNELERAIIRKRTKGGRLEKAARGHVVGAGPAPYGYRYRRELDPHRKRHVTVGLMPDPLTAPIVERIYEEARTCSVVEIAAGLQSDGVPLPATWTPTAKRPLPSVWSTKTVHRILTDPVYRGAWSYGGIAVPLRPEDAIVTAEQQAMIAACLASRSTRRAPRGTASDDAFTLRGMLICGHCRGPLSVNTTAGATGRYRRYVCGRSLPSRCTRYGWKPCPGPLPMLLAAAHGMCGVEDLAWDLVVAFEERPERFAALVAEQDARGANARLQWQETISVLDQQIALHERRVRRAREERQDYERGTDGYQQYVESEGKAQHALDGLRAERDAVLSRRPPGAAPEEIAGALAYIRGKLGIVAAGRERDKAVRRLRAMGPADRRQTLARLGVRGVVWRDSEGERVGRAARVRIEWEVLGGDVRSGTSFLKLVFVHTAAGLTLAAAA